MGCDVMAGSLPCCPVAKLHDSQSCQVYWHGVASQPAAWLPGHAAPLFLGWTVTIAILVLSVSPAVHMFGDQTSQSPDIGVQSTLQFSGAPSQSPFDAAEHAHGATGHVNSQSTSQSLGVGVGHGTPLFFDGVVIVIVLSCFPVSLTHSCHGFQAKMQSTSQSLTSCGGQARPLFNGVCVIVGVLVCFPVAASHTVHSDMVKAQSMAHGLSSAGGQAAPPFFG